MVAERYPAGRRVCDPPAGHTAMYQALQATGQPEKEGAMRHLHKVGRGLVGAVGIVLFGMLSALFVIVGGAALIIEFVGLRLQRLIPELSE